MNKNHPDHTPIPVDPKTEIAVLRRFLHIIALLQNRNDQHNWNGSTLAELLTQEEQLLFPEYTRERGIADHSIRNYIDKYLVNNLHLPVDKSTGGKKICLCESIEPELLRNILSIYLTFICHDSGKEAIISNIIEADPGCCLWKLAKIYFASLTGQEISFHYVNNNGKHSTKTIRPYHLFLKNNNLYLCGLPENGNTTYMFIVSRITDVRETGNSFDTSGIPTLDKTLNNTMGSFLGEAEEVQIWFTEELYTRMKEILVSLDPHIEALPRNKAPYTWQATFTISDNLYLCKSIFIYGNQVLIVKPQSLREKMVSLLRETINAYTVPL